MAAGSPAAPAPTTTTSAALSQRFGSSAASASVAPIPAKAAAPMPPMPTAVDLTKSRLERSVFDAFFIGLVLTLAADSPLPFVSKEGRFHPEPVKVHLMRQGQV